jgi:E3 ubiquitin-protein ligase BRE1
MRKLVLDLNKRLKCTLCGDREKNAVISGAQGKGCMHVFCYECLENQIKDRNRKCPVCKHMFDKADIKRLYLDFGEK